MPHIEISQLSKEEVITLSQEVLTPIITAIQTPGDKIKFYAANNNIIVNSEAQNEVIFVNIKWFKRSEAMRTEVAAILTTALKKRGFEEILIYFEDIKGEYYYSNMDNSKR